MDSSSQKAVAIHKLPWGLSLAKKAFRKDVHRKKVTAAYIEGNTIIIGSNSKKTDPMAQLFGHRMNYTHAELSVLKHINDGSKGTLYVYREKANGQLALSKPCSSCQALITRKNIKVVYYTTEGGYTKFKFN